jgi:hypothetical protein
MLRNSDGNEIKNETDVAALQTRSVKELRNVA